MPTCTFLFLIIAKYACLENYLFEGDKSKMVMQFKNVVLEKV